MPTFAQGEDISFGECVLENKPTSSVVCDYIVRNDIVEECRNPVLRRSSTPKRAQPMVELAPVWQ